jgi:hypothetical protein
MYGNYYVNNRYHMWSFAGLNNTGINYWMWVHGFGDPGHFYGQYFDTTLTYLFGAKPGINKIYYNTWYRLEVTKNGVNDEIENFDAIQAYTDYQDSGEIALSSYNRVKRHMRYWGIEIPTDLTAPTAYDKKQHMTNDWLFWKFKFINTYETTPRKFLLHEVTAYYDISNL